MDDYESRRSSQASSVTGIKEHFTQIKLLTYDNSIKQQQVELLKEQVIELEEQVTALVHEKQQLLAKHRAQLEDSEIRAQTLQDKNINLERFNDSTIQSLQECQEKLTKYACDLQSLQQYAHEQEEGKREILREFQSCKNSFSDVQAASKKQRQKVRQLKDSNKELEAEVSQLKDQLKAVTQQLQGVTREKAQLQQDTQHALEQLRSLNENLQREVSAHNTTKQELRQIKSMRDEMSKDYQLAENLRLHQDELADIKILEKEQLLQNALREKGEALREVQKRERECLMLKEQLLGHQVGKIKELEMALEAQQQKILNFIVSAKGAAQSHANLRQEHSSGASEATSSFDATLSASVVGGCEEQDAKSRQQQQQHQDTIIRPLRQCIQEMLLKRERTRDKNRKLQRALEEANKQNQILGTQVQELEEQLIMARDEGGSHLQLLREEYEEQIMQFGSEQQEKEQQLLEKFRENMQFIQQLQGRVEVLKNEKESLTKQLQETETARAQLQVRGEQAQQALDGLANDFQTAAQSETALREALREALELELRHREKLAL